MPITGKFDPLLFGDSTQFDIKGEYTGEISETVVINDSVSRRSQCMRSMLEPPSGVGIFDDAIFGDATQFDLSQSTVTVSDVVSRVHGFVRGLIEDPIVVQDVVDRLMAFSRAISETVTTNDSVVRIKNAVRSIIEPFSQMFDDGIFGDSDQFDLNTQTVNIEDSVVIQKGYARIITENETIMDSVDRIVSFFRTISDTAITSIDSVSRTLTSIRTITEDAITNNDNVSRILGFQAIISETATDVMDSIDRLMNTSVSISETTIVDDSVTRLRSSFRTISGVVVSTMDSISRTWLQNRVIIEDALSVDDTIDRIKSRLRSAVFYLTKRVSKAYITARNANAYLTKRDNSNGDLT